MIPKHIHWIWLGSPVPQDIRNWMVSWVVNHPGYNFTIHTSFVDLQNQGLYDRFSVYSQKADVARLEILYRYGGLYIDTDFECFRSLAEFFDGEHDILLAKERDFSIAMGLIMARPQHPFIKYLIDNLPAWADSHPGTTANVQSGPVFLTEMVKLYGKPLNVIEDTALFYPYWIGEPFHREDRSYAAHHWKCSWA